MKALTLILLLAVSLPATAQTAADIYHRACGPQDASFQLRHVKGDPPAAPERGQALVFFIQKSAGNNLMTRLGLDGSWAGVIQGDSYIYASVTPGEHHVCAASMDRRHPQPELIHFTAEPGKIYYYLVRTQLNEPGDPLTLRINPADRDEALYLLASDPATTATPKP